jgi:hypothetical protein
VGICVGSACGDLAGQQGVVCYLKGGESFLDWSWKIVGVGGRWRSRGGEIFYWALEDLIGFGV